jgi:hypothetical protein
MRRVRGLQDADPLHGHDRTVGWNTPLGADAIPGFGANRMPAPGGASAPKSVGHKGRVDEMACTFGTDASRLA